MESDDEEPICQDGNLKALQLLVENELQTVLDHPIMFLGHNLCMLGKQGKLQELASSLKWTLRDARQERTPSLDLCKSLSLFSAQTDVDIQLQCVIQCMQNERL